MGEVWFVERREKSQTFAMRAEGKVSGPQIEGEDFLDTPAGSGHRIHVRVRQIVGRIGYLRGGEIDRPAILRPHYIVFLIFAARELFGRYRVFRTLRRRRDPNVLNVLGIEIARTIHTVDRARDHANVALMFWLGFRWFG